VDGSTTIIGFDSAWTDKATAPGAVCAIRQTSAGLVFEPPRLATFRQALGFVRDEERLADRVLVALDQPTIVNNASGSRPVDKVAGSLVSWIGGGVQPANRSKIGMFDDTAPIWRFKEELGALEDPEAARQSVSGLHIIEVFPALGLPSLIPVHCGRLLGAKYNPERRKTFRLDHWSSVAECVVAFGLTHRIAGLSAWARSHGAVAAPRKSDQDLLDAVLCAMVGYLWLFAERSELLLIGDLQSGYMVTPAVGEARARLIAAARTRAVLAQ
jgi:predicted RNase H-like nuclease